MRFNNSIDTANLVFDKIVTKKKKEPLSLPSNTIIPDDYEAFNKLIGLPKHPFTLQESPMMPWQLQYFVRLQHEKELRFGKSPLKVHEKKARQIGATDNGQRFFAFHGSGLKEHNSIHWYVGKKIINIAGTREKTAKKIQQRLRTLFNNIENTIADNGTDLWFKLKNGTEYEAMPSNSEAARGDTKIGAIAVDEAAHFKILDDSVIPDAIVPISDTNLADLFYRSTPNGKRGFFYTTDMEENDFIKLTYDIFVTEGYLHSKERIAEILARKDVDVDQEYLCKYTTSLSAVFTEEMLEEVRDETHRTTDLRKLLGY